MTKPTRSAERCDRIISLIDECLAEVTGGLRLIAGEDRPSTGAPGHLAVVRS